MAYTKTPVADIYKSDKVPLTVTANQRTWDNQSDPFGENVVWEPVDNAYTGEKMLEAIKRDGLSIFGQSQHPTQQLATGIFNWTAGESIVIVYVDRILRISYDNAITTFMTTQFNTAALPGFTEFLYQSGNVGLVISNGVSLFIMQQNNTSTVLSPVPNVGQHLANPVFLDGYLFLADMKGNIWHSQLNDPLTWPPANFIAVESYPDKLTYLTRQNNYIVAMGELSIEFFYNAANANGSVLAPMESATIPIGVYSGNATTFGSSIFFVGRSQGGNLGVYQLENFKPTDISTPTIRRYIQNVPPIVPPDLVTLSPSMISLKGHMHLFLSFWPVYNGGPIFPPAQFPVTKGYSLAYDLESKLWSRQTIGSTGRMAVRQTATGINKGINGEYLTTFVLFDYDSQAYIFSPGVTTDASALFPMRIVTPAVDFGTRRRKFMSRLILDCDIPRTDAADNPIQISYSDDDGRTTVNSLDLQLNQFRPMADIWIQGTFRRRIFQFLYLGNNPMRVRDMEINYMLGDT